MPPNARVIEIPRGGNPFPQSGVCTDGNGVPRYDGLPATLLDVLAEYFAEGSVEEVGAGVVAFRRGAVLVVNGGVDLVADRDGAEGKDFVGEDSLDGFRSSADFG